METIIEFFNMAIGLINDARDDLNGLMERLVLWGVVLWLKAQLFALEIAYAIASALIEGIGISTFIESTWASIDNTTLSVLTYLRIPEGLNLIVSASVTRFIMDLMP